MSISSVFLGSVYTLTLPNLLVLLNNISRLRIINFSVLLTSESVLIF